MHENIRHCTPKENTFNPNNEGDIQLSYREKVKPNPSNHNLSAEKQKLGLKRSPYSETFF